MSKYTKLGAGDVALPPDAPFEQVRGILINASRIVVAPVIPNEGKPCSYTAAMKAATALAFDGQQWRAGEIEELFPIADPPRFDSALDPAYFQFLIDAIKQTDCWWIWSATADASAPVSYAWSLHLGYGNSNPRNQYLKGLPLAVRGPVSR